MAEFTEADRDELLRFTKGDVHISMAIHESHENRIRAKGLTLALLAAHDALQARLKEQWPNLTHQMRDMLLAKCSPHVGMENKWLSEAAVEAITLLEARVRELEGEVAKVNELLEDSNGVIQKNAADLAESRAENERLKEEYKILDRSWLETFGKSVKLRDAAWNENAALRKRLEALDAGLRDAIGQVNPPNETRFYAHFVRLREPRPDEVGRLLFAVPAHLLAETPSTKEN